MSLKARSQKDMRVVRKTLPFARAVKEKVTGGVLKNYSANGKQVAMHWDMNEAAKTDRMFELAIGTERAIIDLEELLSYTRLI